MVIRASAKASMTLFTHGYTANNAFFSGRVTHRRYRDVAPSPPRYVVTDKVRKAVLNPAIDIRDIGYPSHKRSNPGIFTRPIAGEFYKIWATQSADAKPWQKPAGELLAEPRANCSPRGNA
jgi:hypothetical protein